MSKWKVGMQCGNVGLQRLDSIHMLRGATFSQERNYKREAASPLFGQMVVGIAENEGGHLI